MKLVLYSDEKEVPNSKADLKALDLTGKPYKDIKFGYIPSVSDKNREHFNGTKDYWSKYDLTNFIYADIDEEYENINLDELKKCDIIYLSGGNTFKFMNNIRNKKFDVFLKEFVTNGGVLIGISAGAIVQTPTLESTYEYHKTIGDLNTRLPEGFNGLEGLNFVDFEFIPHFDQGEKKEFLNKYIKNKDKYNIYAAKEGSAVIVEDEIVTYYGVVHQFKSSK